MCVSGAGVSRQWKSLALCMPNSVRVCVCMHILYMCVCVLLEDRFVGLPTPLAPVRNLPFSLLKAGETMEGGVEGGGGMMTHWCKSERSVMM